MYISLVCRGVQNKANHHFILGALRAYGTIRLESFEHLDGLSRIVIDAETEAGSLVRIVHATGFSKIVHIELIPTEQVDDAITTQAAE